MDLHLDTLTGLYKADYFLRRFHEEVSRNLRYKRPLSFILLEVDFMYFSPEIEIKWDLSYTIYKQMGALLLKLYPNIMACHFSSDTFAIMLPEADETEAFKEAENIRKTVESHEFLGLDPSNRVKVALNGGIAAFSSHGKTTGELLQKARLALEAAKGDGGNKIKFASAEVLEAAERAGADRPSPNIDKLTGLYIQKYFEKRLGDEIERAGKFARPLSVLVFEIDFDFYKSDYAEYDVKAHLAYSLFRQFGKVLKDTCRTVDIAGRISGGFFAVMLPETPAEGAVRAAERLNQKIDETVFEGDEVLKTLKIAVNGGVAVFPVHGKDSKELMTAAQKALNLARSAGGNKSLLKKSPVHSV
ncbi:MAG: GGDEF domain-containing protein [Firmicutes bacterium]|nr:GGDEF domain-containing protein [Bacillota bacterium]